MHINSKNVHKKHTHLFELDKLLHRINYNGNRFAEFLDALQKKSHVALGRMYNWIIKCYDPHSIELVNLGIFNS